jgi:hypothetical protein
MYNPQTFERPLACLSVPPRFNQTTRHSKKMVNVKLGFFEETILLLQAGFQVQVNFFPYNFIHQKSAGTVTTVSLSSY